MRQIGLLATSLLAGCASLAPAGTPLTGSWGGTHVGLALDATGGRLEYDCAAGTVGPIVPGPNGVFQVRGTHTPAAGGPDRVGEVRPTFHADFVGRVRGDRMSLTGTIENGVMLGPFELRRGAEPIIFRCL
jgi:hypothetical protein